MARAADNLTIEERMTSEGKSSTTIGIYLRSLRAIINEAIDNGLMRREDYSSTSTLYSNSLTSFSYLLNIRV